MEKKKRPKSNPNLFDLSLSSLRDNLFLPLLLSLYLIEPLNPFGRI